MAIDNAEKRRTAFYFDGSIATPTPNSAKDDEWRYQIAGLYAFGSAPVAFSVDMETFVISEPPRKNIEMSTIKGTETFNVT